MNKFFLEFVLFTRYNSISDIKNSIIEFGENLKMDILANPEGLEEKVDIKICIETLDPAAIFDACAQFGRIKSVRIDEKDK